MCLSQIPPCTSLLVYGYFKSLAEYLQMCSCFFRAFEARKSWNYFPLRSLLRTQYISLKESNLTYRGLLCLLDFYCAIGFHNEKIILSEMYLPSKNQIYLQIMFKALFWCTKWFLKTVPYLSLFLLSQVENFETSANDML